MRRQATQNRHSVCWNKRAAAFFTVHTEVKLCDCNPWLFPNQPFSLRYWRISGNWSANFIVWW